MLELVDELVAGLQVTPMGDDRFAVAAPDWFDEERVFGGVVVAHAMNAALQTVDDAVMRPHSLHASFLRPVRAGGAADLEVARLRDGRSFRTRQVKMSQDGRAVLWAMVSFHGDEPGDDYQLRMPGGVPPPDDLPVSEWGGPVESHEAGPVLDVDGTYRSTRRVWLRLPGPLAGDAALHATLATYLSDMTGSSFRPLSLDTWGTHTDASLDHAIWLHRPFRVDEWLLYDLQAVINLGGRSLVRGSLYSSDGRLCLSMAQELLIREL